MADTLDALAAVQALAGPVNDLGGRFMLHPETFQAGTDAGYTNPFAFYGVGRGGVLGDADADVVVAAFGFFEPGMVRALWNEGVQVEGARAAGHRYAQICAEWGRTRLGSFDGAARLAELAERVVAGADLIGLPLFAGWRAEPLPEDAPGRAYQLIHVLREWRGAAHVVAVATSGLTPLDAVTVNGGEGVARMFGWTGDLPDPAALADRQAAAEALTDEMLVPTIERTLSPEERAELVTLVHAAKAALDAA